jgi:tetratricopeptide (TPR) repeat protein
LKKDSADGRVFIWKNCLQLAKEKPLLGHGIYSFTKEYNEQQINYFRQNPDDTKNGMLCDDALFAFNDYLQIATESGCIGLALFLLIVFFVFTARNKEEGSHADSIFTGSKACIISILVCALFSYPLQMVQIYFIFIFSIAYITSKTKPIFHIEGFASKLIIILIILFVLSTEIFQVKKFLACTKWKKAYTCSMKNQFSESELIYEDAYPVLKTDPFFLFNYGSTLTKINECDKSITMLNKVTDYRTFYDLFLNLGHAYENVHNDSLAEQSYQNAASLIPHMYTPRYYLFKLYKRSGQGNKATEMAREISEMKTKVYSHTVGHIKNEAIDYLKKEELKSGNYNNDQTKHKLL